MRTSTSALDNVSHVLLARNDEREGDVQAEHESNAAIRTPDQRLRVFISSTLTELAEERTAVARAISALRLTPVLFELGAQSHPPRELYRAYLAQSDIFIGMYQFWVQKRAGAPLRN